VKRETSPSSRSLAPPPAGDAGDLILYRTEDGRTRLEVRLVRESLWLSLNQLAVLFQRDKSFISKHIKSIFQDGKVDPAATVARFAAVQDEGGRAVSREIECYRLEVILAGWLLDGLKKGGAN
jgi:hypothetical protein